MWSARGETRPGPTVWPSWGETGQERANSVVRVRRERARARGDGALRVPAAVDTDKTLATDRDVGQMFLHRDKDRGWSCGSSGSGNAGMRGARLGQTKAPILSGRALQLYQGVLARVPQMRNGQERAADHCRRAGQARPLGTTCSPPTIVSFRLTRFGPAK